CSPAAARTPAPRKNFIAATPTGWGGWGAAARAPRARRPRAHADAAHLSPAMRARIDAEDVALSAWRSFFELAESGNVVLGQAGDLWRLLARITLRKVCRGTRRQRAACRDVE